MMGAMGQVDRSAAAYLDLVESLTVCPLRMLPCRWMSSVVVLSQGRLSTMLVFPTRMVDVSYAVPTCRRVRCPWPSGSSPASLPVVANWLYRPPCDSLVRLGGTKRGLKKKTSLTRARASQ